MLDVGTGCGAIAVTLAANLPRARVLAVDVSRGGLSVARGNAMRLGVADRILFLSRGRIFRLEKRGPF